MAKNRFVSLVLSLMMVFILSIGLYGDDFNSTDLLSGNISIQPTGIGDKPW